MTDLAAPDASAGVAIDAAAATALVAAAATATPPSTDLGAWTAAVGERAEAMLRLVPAIVGRSAVLAGCRPVTGVIVKVEEASGRGKITFHATMGEPAEDQEVVNGRGVEYARTLWLSEPAGQALFEQARSLIGRNCRYGKWSQQLSRSKKVSYVEWIEDLGPDPLTVNNTSTPTSSAPANGQRRPIAYEPSQSAPSQPERPARSPGSVTRPSREDVAKAAQAAAEHDARRLGGGKWTPETFVEEGWEGGQAEHDKARQLVTAKITSITEPAVKERLAAWSKAQGYVWTEPWTADRLYMLRAKLDSLVAEDLLNRQPVGVGGGEGDFYGPDGDPF